jgi:hypothetical protein
MFLRGGRLPKVEDQDPEEGASEGEDRHLPPPPHMLRVMLIRRWDGGRLVFGVRPMLRVRWKEQQQEHPVQGGIGVGGKKGVNYNPLRDKRDAFMELVKGSRWLMDTFVATRLETWRRQFIRSSIHIDHLNR